MKVGLGSSSGQHLYEEPEALAVLAPQAPSAVIELVNRLLLKDKTLRPSMSETAEVLGYLFSPVHRCLHGCALAASLGHHRGRDAAAAYAASIDNLGAVDWTAERPQFSPAPANGRCRCSTGIDRRGCDSMARSAAGEVQCQEGRWDDGYRSSRQHDVAARAATSSCAISVNCTGEGE